MKPITAKEAKEIAIKRGPVNMQHIFTGIRRECELGRFSIVCKLTNNETNNVEYITDTLLNLGYTYNVSSDGNFEYITIEWK